MNRFLILSLVLSIGGNSPCFGQLLLTSPQMISIDSNLAAMPQDVQTSAYSEITLPDLHGNALKCLHALVASGVVAVDAEVYQCLQQIYFQPTASITAADIQSFETNLAKISLNAARQDTLIRFIGDEFCDRGTNDLWTLLLLAKLQQLGLKMEFILSNHSLDFVLALEDGSFLPKTLCSGSQTSSLEGLKVLIDKKLVTKEQVVSLAKVYKDRLKIVSYSLDQSTSRLTLYTHALVGLGELKDLATLCNVQFNDATALELAQTIDAINSNFGAMFVGPNQMRKILVEQAGRCKILPAIEPFLWNRSNESLKRPDSHKDYHLSFVHGHDGSEPTKGNVFNLDRQNSLGKTPLKNLGFLRLFVLPAATAEETAPTISEAKNSKIEV